MGYDIDNDINHTQAIVDTSKQLKEYAMGEGAKYYSDVKHEFKFTDANGTEHVINMSKMNLKLSLHKLGPMVQLQELVM